MRKLLNNKINCIMAASLLTLTGLSMTACTNHKELSAQTVESQTTEAQAKDSREKEFETKDTLVLNTDDTNSADNNVPKVTSMSVKKKEAVQSFADTDETAYVTADSVNIRKEPSTSSEVLKKLNKGTKVQRTGKNEEWSRIVVEGKTVFISTRFLTLEAPATQAAEASTAAGGNSVSQLASGAQIKLNPEWRYAGNSKINSGYATLYKAEGNRKDITVCVNAGHGTKGGSSVKTLCHPDGTPKVTGGTTAQGATTAVAVSSGMTFQDGTSEASVTLKMAKALKTELLSRGYDVLMIRESDDVQLDNIARTVIANNTASCHIALHWDSTASNKGAFYMGVPEVASYRNMEPVASTWEKHEALGKSLVQGLKNAGVKIFDNGRLPMDLTQTSYSTIASIDIELGDKASDHSDATINGLAKGLADGVGIYFGK
jgi:hypothetical protein